MICEGEHNRTCAYDAHALSCMQSPTPVLGSRYETQLLLTRSMPSQVWYWQCRHEHGPLTSLNILQKDVGLSKVFGSTRG
jgi:hypothetical protein